jgi:hypothetical protein
MGMRRTYFNPDPHGCLVEGKKATKTGNTLIWTQDYLISKDGIIVMKLMLFNMQIQHDIYITKNRL